MSKKDDAGQSRIEDLGSKLREGVCLCTKKRFEQAIHLLEEATRIKMKIDDFGALTQSKKAEFHSLRTRTYDLLSICLMKVGRFSEAKVAAENGFEIAEELDDEKAANALSRRLADLIRMDTACGGNDGKQSGSGKKKSAVKRRRKQILTDEELDGICNGDDKDCDGQRIRARRCDFEDMRPLDFGS